MKHFLFLFASLILLVGCKDTGLTKVSATGSIYECLVVAPQSLQQPFEQTMGADMPCLPQMEPYFNVSSVVPAAFDDFLKATRNIILVDINPDRYTHLSVKKAQDLWSTPQAVYRIQAPCEDSVTVFWENHGTQVRDWFVGEEIARQARFLRANTNKTARDKMQQHFDADMLIPEDYMLLMDTAITTVSAEDGTLPVRFLWCCNSKGSIRRDLVVYSFPYTNDSTFTCRYLTSKRDEILSPFISASVEGSYMGTEYKIFPPQMTITNASPYTAQVRGLWKILNGEAMGGPFVSLTMLDTQRNRIVTAEVFVYAAGQKKRNALRQAEAIIHTLSLNSSQVNSASSNAEHTSE